MYCDSVSSTSPVSHPLTRSRARRSLSYITRVPICSSLTPFASLPSFLLLLDRGLETGERNVVTHVVRQNRVILAFSSPLNPVESDITKRIMVSMHD